MNIEKSDKETIEKLDQKIKDAKENFGDLEIRNAICDKAEYYLEKSDYDQSRKLYEEALEKTAGAEKKLEIHLQILHTYYKQKLYTDYQKQLQICLKLNEEGGDWEKKNKLAVYEGIMMIIQRNFPKAAELFLGCVNTFNAPEVISFDTLVYYGCIIGFLVLDRLKIKEKIINNSEIQSVLREDNVIFNFVDCIYQSDYNKYFQNLITLCEEFISKDQFLQPHQEYIIKNSKIRIFNQYLKSFQTVTLDKMGHDFSVSKDFIDDELAQFIANGHLKCQIDKVNGVVSSSQEDPRLELHKEIVRRGDALIARMHNLIRIANI